MNDQGSSSEEHLLQFRWVQHAVLGNTHDPDIESTMQDLEDSWAAGQQLNVVERQALLAKRIHEKIPGFGELRAIPSDSHGRQEYYNGPQGALEAIESSLFLVSGNVPEKATRHGPASRKAKIHKVTLPPAGRRPL